MKRCDSCDGIIGIDCFNPSECAWIGHMQQQQAQANQQMKIRELEERIKELEKLCTPDNN